MKLVTRLTLLLCSLTLPFNLKASEEADSALLKAAAAGDSEKVVLALLEADPNIKNSQGMTPLMLAARKGDFETLRRLLWSGGDPRVETANGKLARDFLSRSHPEFKECNLLLRAYAFVMDHGKIRPEPTRHELCLINDNYIEHDHPMLESRYYANENELRGRPNADDDKNGFIDDVYGWNLGDDEPLRAPQLAIDDSKATHNFLVKLMEDYEKAQNSENKILRMLIQNRLRNSYDNPLVKQIGFNTLAYGKIDLNDYTYANMLKQSSHGNHVAGIVIKESDGKALVHGTTLGRFGTPNARIFQQMPALIGMAKRSESFADFVEAVVGVRRKNALAVGKRSSSYLAATGAGVANMSWQRPLRNFKVWAKQIKEVYQKHGKNPDTIETASSKGKLDLIDQLPLELLVSDAATFALVFYENPNVLFVLSANNEGRNNDVTLPSPAYLSRFFPNVITIASHDPKGRLSRFSNYGVRSVSLAAPGEEIESAFLAGLNGKMQGTSMAAPAVAGVAAAIRADNRNLDAYDVRQILESTVTEKPEWKDKLFTGGMLNKPAALAMAKAWASGNAAILLDEVRRATREVEERSVGGGPAKPRVGAKQTKPSDFPIKSGKGSLMLTQVAGGPAGWCTVMQAGTRQKVPQVFTYEKQFPIKWVKKNWDAGFSITDVGGSSSGGWGVTMDKVANYGQRLVGFKIDQAAISKNMAAGYRITDLSGYGKNWVICMSNKTGWGKQRFTLPSSFDAKRIEWLKARWNEGYRITSMGGDDLPGVDDDGYLIVMTKNSGLDQQSIFGPGAWPAKQITAAAKKGRAITAVAGSPGRWLVVVSSESGVTKQKLSQGGPISADFIKKGW